MNVSKLSSWGVALLSCSVMACAAQVGPEGEEIVPDDGLATDSDALTASMEGESFGVESGYQTNGSYYGRYVRAFWSNGWAGHWFYSPVRKNTTLNIMAMGTSCWSTPSLRWYMDNPGGGVQGGGWDGVASSWSGHRTPIALKAGWNYLHIGMGNDQYQPGVCDANMFVDYAHIWD